MTWPLASLILGFNAGLLAGAALCSAGMNRRLERARYLAECEHAQACAIRDTAADYMRACDQAFEDVNRAGHVAPTTILAFHEASWSMRVALIENDQ